MTDEKFVLISDIKDKKRTARGGFNKVRKKGGRVKLPSDYMTEKERAKLNGDVKSFDLKQPMKWAEFCAMPDDLQKEYISRLQKLYRATDVAIGEMMGVSKTSIHKARMRFGLEGGERGVRPLPEWDSFVKHGTPTEGKVAETAKAEEKPIEKPIEKPHPVERFSAPFAVPLSGDIRLKGSAAMIGETLFMLTNGKEISCRISWEVMG